MPQETLQAGDRAARIPARIVKQPGGWRVPPHLADHDAVCRGFDWADARRALDGLPDGRGLNIAHEAVDRHVGTDREHRCAIRWLGRHGAREELSYGELAERTSRFANVLIEDLGVQAGESVFVPERARPRSCTSLRIGTLKRRLRSSLPLFAAFGPEPVSHAA
jgi:acetyl-CoA synthetase